MVVQNIFGLSYIFRPEYLYYPSQLSSRISRLYLYRANKNPTTNEFPGYYIKTSDGEAPVLKFGGLWSTLSLSLLPGPLPPGFVGHLSVPFKSRMKLFYPLVYLNHLSANK